MLNKKTILMIFVIIMTMSLVLAGCSTKDSNDEAVAKVNGKVITKSDFDKYLNFLTKDAEIRGGIAQEMLDEDAGEGKTYLTLLKETALNELINKEIVIQQAQEKDINVSDDDVKKEISGFKNTDETKEKFEKYLDDMGITEEYFSKLYKEDMVRIKLVDETIKVEDEDIEEFHNNNKDEFIEVEARHILVDTEEEALAIIEELNSGADFEELAKEKSTGPSGPDGGYLGFFGKNQMLSEFEDAAFKLNPGEISEPVKTTYGYHVIKVEDKKDTFEEKLSTNLEGLINVIKNEKFNIALNNWKENSEIEKYLDIENK